MKRVYAVFLIVVAIYFFWSSGRSPARGRFEPQPVPAEGRRPGRQELSAGPLTARLVLVDRPDEAVRVAKGEFPPAPGLVAGLTGNAEDRPLVQAMLVERVHVVDLHLEVDSHAQPRVVELLGVGLLGVDHQGEVAQPEDRQGIGGTLLLGMNLDHLRADDLVIELERPANVLDVQKDARDSGRHSPPLSRPRSRRTRP